MGEEGATPLIRSARFRAEREADWRRLEALVATVDKRGLTALSFEEAQALAHLYRSAVNSLSVAREISLDRALLTYLEVLCARAYLAVYAPAEGFQGLLRRFLRVSAPAAVRRCWPEIVLAAVTLFLGGLSGYALFFENPSWYDVVVPRSLGDPRGPEATREDLLRVIYDDAGGRLGALGAFASELFSNNARIAIFAFALGAFAGLLTFLLVFYNGLILGLFVALHVDRDVGLDIFGWLSIHGVTELAAVVLAAGAGFKLGRAVLFPGRWRRADALRLAADDAVKVALVAALMLVAAALLEGFGRELINDTATRLVIGWGAGPLWLTWFLSGRRP